MGHPDCGGWFRGQLSLEAEAEGLGSGHTLESLPHSRDQAQGTQPVQRDQADPP